MKKMKRKINPSKIFFIFVLSVCLMFGVVPDVFDGFQILCNTFQSFCLFFSQEINRDVLGGTKASHDEDDRSFDMEHLQDGVSGLVRASSTHVLIHADKLHHAGLSVF